MLFDLVPTYARHLRGKYATHDIRLQCGTEALPATHSARGVQFGKARTAFIGGYLQPHPHSSTSICPNVNRCMPDMAVSLKPETLASSQLLGKLHCRYSHLNSEVVADTKSTPQSVIWASSTQLVTVI